MNSSVKQAHIQQAQAVCRKYCGQVRRSLFCPAALREPILSQLEEAVLFYLEEHPQAGMDELCAHFGAAVCLQASGDDVDQGGFTRTVGSEKAIKARAEGEVHPGQGLFSGSGAAKSAAPDQIAFFQIFHRKEKGGVRLLRHGWFTSKMELTGVVETKYKYYSISSNLIFTFHRYSLIICSRRNHHSKEISFPVSKSFQ